MSKSIKFEAVKAISEDLTDWEKNFVTSIDNQLNRYGRELNDLSEKQLAIIDRIYDKHCSKAPPDKELPESFVPDRHNKFIPPGDSYLDSSI